MITRNGSMGFTTTYLAHSHEHLVKRDNQKHTIRKTKRYGQILIMGYRTFASKINRNKKEIARTVGFFIVLRSLHGLSILALAYFLGWDLQDLREFEVLGFRVYFLVLAIVAILVTRRFYKIYKWWNKESEEQGLT